MMKGCMDDHVIQRCETKLELARNVKELFLVLKDQEEVFCPSQKRHKTFMRTKRKSSKDPMTYLAELRKMARFCQIHKIVD